MSPEAVSALKRHLLASDFFVNNKYLSLYLELISLNLNNQAEGYTENHHVIPCAVYRIKYNLTTRKKAETYAKKDHLNFIIPLSITDHLYAHYLLYFCTKGKLRTKMASVLYLMGNHKKIEVFSLDPAAAKAYIEQFIAQVFFDRRSISGNGFWTFTEDLFLQNNYTSFGLDFCADYLKDFHTRHAVTTRASRLGLIANKETYRLKNQPNPWSIEELRFLKANYAILTQKELSKKLKRTIGGIQGKARELGIRGLRQQELLWTEDQDNYLKQNYSKVPLKICVECLQKTAESIKTRAAYLGVANKRKKYSQEEIVFIQKHYFIEGPQFCAKSLNRSKQAIHSFRKQHPELQYTQLIEESYQQRRIET